MALRVNEIVLMLERFVIHPVILGNQAAPRPSYPYIAINETTQYSPQAGHVENKNLPEDIKQIYVSQPTFTLSVTAYGNQFDDTRELAERAFVWFSFSGFNELKNAGFIVVDQSDITNRDSLIVDDYERRRGFDVTIRFADKQERVIEEIKKVSGKVNELPFEGVKK